MLWGLVFPIAGPLGWGARPGAQNSHSCGGNLCNITILHLWATNLGVRDLIISQVCSSYPSGCGSFFMSFVVEDLFW